jgi:IS6 family transposase
VKKWQIPRFINTDKAPAYGRALALLKREGRCPSDVEHRQIKYRNNVIECDQRQTETDNRRHADLNP